MLLKYPLPIIVWLLRYKMQPTTSRESFDNWKNLFHGSRTANYSGVTTTHETLSLSSCLLSKSFSFLALPAFEVFLLSCPACNTTTLLMHSSQWVYQRKFLKAFLNVKNSHFQTGSRFLLSFLLTKSSVFFKFTMICFDTRFCFHDRNFFLKSTTAARILKRSSH